MNLFITILSFLALTILTDYTGSWGYTVASPDGGTITAEFVFAKENGKYVGHIAGDEGTLPLKDLKIEGENFSCNFYYQGYRVNLKGAFKGDVLNCTGSAEGYEFPIVAKKKK